LASLPSWHDRHNRETFPSKRKAVLPPSAEVWQDEHNAGSACGFLVEELPDVDVAAVPSTARADWQSIGTNKKMIIVLNTFSCISNFQIIASFQFKFARQARQQSFP